MLRFLLLRRDPSLHLLDFHFFWNKPFWRVSETNILACYVDVSIELAVLIVKLIVLVIGNVVGSTILIVPHLSLLWICKLDLGSKPIGCLIAWNTSVSWVIHVILLVDITLIKLLLVYLSFWKGRTVPTRSCRVCFDIFISSYKNMMTVLMKVFVLLSHLVKGVRSLVLITLEFLHLVITHSIALWRWLVLKLL